MLLTSRGIRRKEFSTLVSAPSSSRISDFSPGVAAASAVLLSSHRRFRTSAGIENASYAHKARFQRDHNGPNGIGTLCGHVQWGAVFHKGTRGIKNGHKIRAYVYGFFSFFPNGFYLFVLLLFSLTRRSTHIRPDVVYRAERTRRGRYVKSRPSRPVHVLYESHPVSIVWTWRERPAAGARRVGDARSMRRSTPRIFPFDHGKHCGRSRFRAVARLA